MHLLNASHSLHLHIKNNLLLPANLLYFFYFVIQIYRFIKPNYCNAFPEYEAPGNLIHLTAMTPTKPSETAKPIYNEDDYDCTGASVVLTFEYGLVNIFLSEWCEMKTK